MIHFYQTYAFRHTTEAGKTWSEKLEKKNIEIRKKIDSYLLM